MANCLGIQIEQNIIKYAKVKKEKDLVKVEAFNVMFYEDLKATLKQIIAETNSFKTPISINLSDEMYNYFQVSSLLNKQDMKKAVEIDFELMCDERNLNKSNLETRYLFAPSFENSERLQAISLTSDKNNINKLKREFSGYKLDYISPMATSIANLIEPSNNSNILIINIEEHSKVTVLSNGQIVRTENISEGMNDILNKISVVENSKTKAYEVCKNTTLYSQDGVGIVSEGNEYAEQIIPTLSTIIEKTKDIIEDCEINISNIYISGLATSINNIDLYFQEFFESIKCEVLRPYFINVASVKTSVKDYIEVNSAIALALNGIGYGYKEINFADGNKLNQNVDLGGLFKPIGGKKQYQARESIKAPLEPMERMTVKILYCILIALLGYIICVSVLSKKIDNKNGEVQSSLNQLNTEIGKADKDLNNITDQTNAYEEKINNLNNLEDNKYERRIISKNSIPNLLYRFVTITPKKVQIVSVENTEGTDHIIIQAKSEDYEQLGFFKAAIATNGYLQNVKSTSGTKTDSEINVTIEGDLP